MTWKAGGMTGYTDVRFWATFLSSEDNIQTTLESTSKLYLSMWAG